MGLSTVTMASAPMGLPFCLTVFISEIFSSSGQPASLTPKTLALKEPSFSLKAGGTTVFALVVAFDAVVGLVEGELEIGAGIGELETFAMTPVIRR